MVSGLEIFLASSVVLGRLFRFFRHGSVSDTNKSLVPADNVNQSKIIKKSRPNHTMSMLTRSYERKLWFFLPDKLTIQCQMLQSKVLRHFKKYKSWHTFSNLENFSFMFFLEINFESEMIFKNKYWGQIRTRYQWMFGILHKFFEIIKAYV